MPSTTSIYAKIPPELHRQVRDIADQYGVTMNEFVKRALTAYIMANWDWKPDRTILP